VTATFLRGEKIWDDGALVAGELWTIVMTDSFIDLLDLASERLGAAAIACNDEFFAAKDNLVKPSAPQWREGEYTDRGKWMDGWETRRRRDLDRGVARLVRRAPRRPRRGERRRRRDDPFQRKLSRVVRD
jgi:hypothetical protein